MSEKDDMHEIFKAKMIILLFIMSCDSNYHDKRVTNRQSEQILTQDQAGISVGAAGKDEQGTGQVQVDDSLAENRIEETLPSLVKYTNSNILCEQVEGNLPVDGVSSGEVYCRVVDEDGQRQSPERDGLSAIWTFTTVSSQAELEMSPSELSEHDIKLKARSDFPVKTWFDLDTAIISVRLEEGSESFSLSVQKKTLLGEDCNADRDDGIDMTLPNELIGIAATGNDEGGNGKRFLIFEDSVLKVSGTSNYFYGQLNSRVEDQGTDSVGVFLAGSNYISSGANNAVFLHPQANSNNPNGINYKFLTAINFCLP